jgi:hypothetical protein
VLYATRAERQRLRLEGVADAIGCGLLLGLGACGLLGGKQAFEFRDALVRFDVLERCEFSAFGTASGSMPSNRARSFSTAMFLSRISFTRAVSGCSPSRASLNVPSSPFMYSARYAGGTSSSVRDGRNRRENCFSRIGTSPLQRFNQFNSKEKNNINIVSHVRPPAGLPSP